MPVKEDLQLLHMASLEEALEEEGRVVDHRCLCHKLLQRVLDDGKHHEAAVVELLKLEAALHLGGRASVEAEDVQACSSATDSTVAEKMTMPMKKSGLISSRPPLARDGAFSSPTRRLSALRALGSHGCTSSDKGQPAAASIARRPCLSSASRYLLRVSMLLAQLTS